MNDIQKFILWKIEELLGAYRYKFGPLRPPILIKNLVELISDKVEKLVCEECPRGKLVRSGKKWNIVIPKHLSSFRKRVEAAHEIAHTFFLDPAYQKGPLREKDIELACERVIRLMLIPNGLLPKLGEVIYERSASEFLLEKCMQFEVTVPIMTERLFGDIEGLRTEMGVKCIVIWAVFFDKVSNKFRASPKWHFPKEFFIPINKCYARDNTATAKAIQTRNCRQIEEVNIGGLRGQYLADAVAYWPKGDHFNRILTTFHRTDVSRYPLFENYEFIGGARDL